MLIAPQRFTVSPIFEFESLISLRTCVRRTFNKNVKHASGFRITEWMNAKINLL